MPTITLHDRIEIEAFLRRSIALHLYALGDLDDFFWPHTIWFGLKRDEELRQLCLLYTGVPGGVLLALGEPPLDELSDLLDQVLSFLPRQTYAHLTPGLETVLARAYHLDSHGLHHKMSLVDPSALSAAPAEAGRGIVALTPDDLPALEALYAASYPDNAFDPRMLETGQYFGVRRDGRLVSVAGIHAYSPRFRVAAIGNVTTHPAYRGQGFGRAVTAYLCRSLLRTVDHIGLNVKADNAAAIACYRSLGFVHTADYEEFSLSAKMTAVDE